MDEQGVNKADPSQDSLIELLVGVAILFVSYIWAG